ncbi:MAG TPA: DUF3054 domain-containing protein [Anaerolineaceae bacterium]|nr:DUF3054 domain-containing protein [Anaerolineaceae bacterium]
MTAQFSNRNLVVLLIGDAVAILAVTLIGFASHELNLLNLRVAATFVPLWAAWLLVSPWLGLYQPEVIRRPGEIWRAGLAAALAAPAAAVLRGLWLNAPVIPVFALVLGGVTALGIEFWRLAWAFLQRGKLTWTK